MKQELAENAAKQTRALLDPMPMVALAGLGEMLVSGFEKDDAERVFNSFPSHVQSIVMILASQCLIDYLQKRSVKEQELRN